ncbi:MAG TPA: hypothetical protein VLA99_02560 [Nitrospiraceae bacterium]|nr:hypothetical protein [Nitrospiraceae bacterium]
MATFTAAPMFRVNRSTRGRTIEKAAAGKEAQWLEPILRSRQCPRCQGFLVGDLCYDIDDDQGQRWCSALRCVQCGDVLDPIIARNRLAVLERRRAEERDAFTATAEFEEERPLLRVSA